MIEILKRIGELQKVKKSKKKRLKASFFLSYIKKSKFINIRLWQLFNLIIQKIPFYWFYRHNYLTQNGRVEAA